MRGLLGSGKLLRSGERKPLASSPEQDRGNGAKSDHRYWSSPVRCCAPLFDHKRLLRETITGGRRSSSASTSTGRQERRRSAENNQPLLDSHPSLSPRESLPLSPQKG